MKEYLTVDEYASARCLPPQNVLAAIRDGCLNHTAIMQRTYERVYLIPSDAQIPKRYVPDLDRFSSKEDLPPWIQSDT